MQAQPCWQALLPVLARRVSAAPLLRPRYGDTMYRDTAPALLALAVGLFRLPPVRERWVSAPGWRDAFEALLTLRQPTPRDLRTLVPRAHWMGTAAGERESREGSNDSVRSCPGEAACTAQLPDLGSGADEGDYRGACAALAAASAAVEDRHLELCAVLAATPTLLTGAGHFTVMSRGGALRRCIWHGLTSKLPAQLCGLAALWTLSPVPGCEKDENPLRP